MFWYIVLIALAIYMYFDTRLPDRMPPGPRIVPFFGNYLWFGASWLRFRSMKLVCMWAMKVYGPVVTLKQFGFTQVLVSGKEALKTVLTSKASNSRTHLPIYQYAYKADGGIFFTNGDIWIRNRLVPMKILKTLGFNSNGMEPTIVEEALELVSILKEKSKELGGAGVPFDHAFHTLVINNLWHFIGGHKFQYGDPTFEKIVGYLENYESKIMNSGLMLNAWPLLRYIVPELTGYKAMKVGGKFCFDYIENLIQEHKQTFNKNNIRDLIDGLLNEMEENKNYKITDANIADVCLDLLLGGLDTSSNSMEYSMLYILLYPDVQQRVQEEIDSVIGRDNLPTLMDITRLPYTSATLFEINRMTTLVPIVPRLAEEDLELNGYRIPKGTIMWVNIYGAHMDKDHWKDPRVFRPERFLKDGQVITDEYYFPFGGGKRRCPGEVLARNAQFLVFTILLQKFNFRLPPLENPPTTKSHDGVVMKPKPFRAIITERT